MGHQGSNGNWRDTDQVTLIASAARTTSGSSAVIEIGDRGTLRLKLDLTVASGTPTLDVVVKTRFDENDAWRVALTFAQLTGVNDIRDLCNVDREVQADYTIGGGTPDVTFSLAGEAV
jgi:hypothetical protein